MDIHYIVTRLVNPRLNRAIALLLEEGRRLYPSPYGEALKGLAERLEEWRSRLAGEKSWGREACRAALDDLKPILGDVEKLAGRGEVYRLLLEVAGELEKAAGLEGYLSGGEGGEARGGEEPESTRGRREAAPRRLEVHYMMTRLVNPRLNRLVWELRGSRVLAGRDGYTRVRWSTFSDSDYIASLLEIWADDVWRRYSDEALAERGRELLDSLLGVAAEAEARLGHSWVVDEIWGLTGDLESYLGLEGYLESLRPAYDALVKSKIEERRRLQEALKRGRRGPRRGKSRSPRSRSRRRSPASTGGGRRSYGGYSAAGSRRPLALKAAAAIAVVLLALLLFPGLTRLLQAPRSIGQPLARPCDRAGYSLSDALRCYLSRSEDAALLRSLAGRLKGGSIAESSWNLLAWEEENLAYDWSRGSYIAGGLPGEIQPPSVTVRRGRGVCVDYAVLTAGVLAYMGYPAYVFEIRFYGTGVGHAAAAVRIDGRFYMLDQRLPPMPLPAYYDYWAYYREGVYEGHRLENLRIKEATVYKVYLEGGQVHVDKIAYLSASQFRSGGHRASREELRLLAEKVAARLASEYPHLTIDPAVLLQDSRAEVWSMEVPMLAEEYDPAFAGQYAGWIYGMLSRAKGFRTAVLRYRRVWVDIAARGDGAVVKVYLAP